MSFFKFQVTNYIKHNEKEVVQHFPNLFLPTKCHDVFYSNSIFTENFIQELSYEMNKTEIYQPLWKLKFEQDWHAIINFFIYPTLCHIFKGFIEPENKGIEGHFSLVKQQKFQNFNEKIYSKLLSTQFAQTFTMVLNLSKPHEEFSGGGIKFHR